MGYGEGNQSFNLCVDCNLKFQQATDIVIKRNYELMNYLTEEMEMRVGLPGMFPRFEIPSPVIHNGEIRMQNINVNNSIVGAINTGTVQTIDVALTVMKEHSEADLSTAIKALTEGVMQSDMAIDKKNEILDQLSVISEEVSKPKEKRRWAMIKPLFTAIGSALSDFDNLLSILDKLKTFLGF